MCRKSVEKAIKFIAKNAERRKTGATVSVFESDYIVYATDGHQAMRTLEDVDEKLIQKPEEDWVKFVTKFFEEDSTTSAAEFDAPNADEFEQKILELKKSWNDAQIRRRALWNIRVAYAVADDVLINADYMLNALRATGVEKFYGTGNKQPFRFYGDDTQYFVLPIVNAEKISKGTFKVFG